MMRSTPCRGSSGTSRGVGLGQHRPVQPGLAVDVARHAQGAQQRPGAPGGERHAGDAADAGDRDRVAGDLLEGLVPGDGGHRDQFDFRASVGEQQRDGVVVPGVAVEEDLAGHGGTSSRTSAWPWECRTYLTSHPT